MFSAELKEASYKDADSSGGVLHHTGSYLDFYILLKNRKEIMPAPPNHCWFLSKTKTTETKLMGGADSFFMFLSSSASADSLCIWKAAAIFSIATPSKGAFCRFLSFIKPRRNHPLEAAGSV